MLCYPLHKTDPGCLINVFAPCKCDKFLRIQIEYLVRRSCDSVISVNVEIGLNYLNGNIYNVSIGTSATKRHGRSLSN